MPDDLIGWLTLLALLGSGLIAGVFLAFSSFVMGALGRLPAEQGAAAMQHINVVVINPWFLGPFMGTAALSVGLVVVGLIPKADPWLVAGGLLYAVGTFGVTVVGNIPLNNALAEIEPDSEGGKALWLRYQRTWTRWNHVRTVAGLLACAAFAVSL